MASRSGGKKCSRTIPGSWLFDTQHEINFNVSFFTVRMLAINGCLVTSSPAQRKRPGAWIWCTHTHNTHTYNTHTTHTYKTHTHTHTHTHNTHIPLSATAVEMFSLSTLYTFSMSRYILPSCNIPSKADSNNMHLPLHTPVWQTDVPLLCMPWRSSWGCDLAVWSSRGLEGLGGPTQWKVTFPQWLPKPSNDDCKRTHSLMLLWRWCCPISHLGVTCTFQSTAPGPLGPWGWGRVCGH